MHDGRAQTMSHDELGVLQEQRLRDAGVAAGDDVTLDDLPRLPTLTKPDLCEHYPWGLLSVPMRDVVAVHGSSGTGGQGVHRDE